MAHRLPRHAPAAPTSPGRVMTKWTKPAATASPNSMHTGRSPARSVSTMAMNPASKPALGDFFNSLLDPEEFIPAQAERRFTVAVNNYAAVVLAGPIIAECAALAPNVRISLRPSGTLNLPELLDRGELDIAIAA